VTEKSIIQTKRDHTKARLNTNVEALCDTVIPVHGDIGRIASRRTYRLLQGRGWGIVNHDHSVDLRDDAFCQAAQSREFGVIGKDYGANAPLRAHLRR
jgi:hypothetical protein